MSGQSPEVNQLLSEVKWLVSDWHFGEPRMDILCRPFASTAEHDQTLIENHNRLVQPADVVLCLGDVTNKEAKNHLRLVGKLNGRKLLIRGNHDAVHSDQQLGKYFEHIVADGAGLELTYEGYSALRDPLSNTRPGGPIQHRGSRSRRLAVPTEYAECRRRQLWIRAVSDRQGAILPQSHRAVLRSGRLGCVRAGECGISKRTRSTGAVPR
ncbi:MAG: hypothetical protein ACI8P0_005270 [Planctomycetaceae bacterium]|jgi:hypothetical protein